MDKPPPKLVLIDGHALLYRAYYGVPQGMATSQGEPTNAVYGFLSTLFKVLREENPGYVVVCLDKGRTFRHDLYPEYKAHRLKMPDDLHSQIERTEQVLEALGIPIYALEGYEADDLIGTLARQAAEAGLETLIVTGDSDALQLVNEHVRVLTPGRRYSDTVVYDTARVREKYGLEPKQLVDFKGLMGDASDNIPGVPGVGEKTATQLVQRFGSIEAVYEHLDEVPTRYRTLLAGNREQAFFSRELARVRTDVPVKLDLEGGRFGAYDREAVLKVFGELEFGRGLLSRLPEPVAPPRKAIRVQQLSFPEQPTGRTSPYEIVRDRTALEAMLRALGRGPLAFDTETTSTRPMETALVGLSLALPDRRAWYIPLGHCSDEGVRLPDQLPWEIVRGRLAPLLEDEGVPKYAHNAKFDLLILARHGLEVRGVVGDTMIAAHLLGYRSVNLKDLARQILGEEMTTIEDLLGKGKSQTTMDRVPIEQVGPYACADADMTCQLQAHLQPRLQEEGLHDLFEQVEMPLVPVLVEMERNGIRLDVEFLREMSRQLEQDLAVLEGAIHALAGHPFNIRSTQQLGQVLFEELGLPTTGIRRTKAGGYSTAVDVLEKLCHQYPIVEKVLEHRELSKLKSTYLDALPALVNPETGRVHTSFHQTVTTTGRLSSSDPNLQNIPVRTELGRQVRRAFVADPGWLLLSADYSQVELRVLAHISGDPGLLGAFNRGEDIHASTAAALFDLPIAEVTPEQRRLAKTVNFGLIYGMSAYGLASRLGIEQEEAERFIRAYFEQFPRVKAYIEKTVQQAWEQGYVTTLLGRRRPIPTIRSENRNLREAAEREAINAPIQGSAADIIKIAMVRLYGALKGRGLRSRLLLQVHDELVLEIPEEEVETVRPLVVETMEGAYPLQAPLRVDVHVATTWEDLK